MFSRVVGVWTKEGDCPRIRHRADQILALSFWKTQQDAERARRYPGPSTSTHLAATRSEQAKLPRFRLRFGCTKFISFWYGLSARTSPCGRVAYSPSRQQVLGTPYTSGVTSFIASVPAIHSLSIHKCFSAGTAALRYRATTGSISWLKIRLERVCGPQDSVRPKFAPRLARR
jgi:hypothetical protein